MSDSPTEVGSGGARGAGTARLLVRCPDRPGIVAAVSGFLHRHNANILESDQHSSTGNGHGSATANDSAAGNNSATGNDSAAGSDSATGSDSAGSGPRFFLRMEFEQAGLAVPLAELRTRFAGEVAAPFAMEWHLSDATRRPRMAVMVSRADHCLQEILWRWRRGELAVEVPLVVGNHAALRGAVEALDIPFHHLPVTPETKAAQEARLLELLAAARVDFVVLARYMQILSPAVIAAYPDAIINIHHSFLPAFAGADPYGRAWERGVKIIGATAHYATADLDEGPIIEQDVVRVSHRHRRGDLVRLGREVERSVLARAVRWHAEDRVLVDGNKTIVFPE